MTEWTDKLRSGTMRKRELSYIIANVLVPIAVVAIALAFVIFVSGDMPRPLG